MPPQPNLQSMMRDTQIRPRNSGKRKRIPLDPNLKQGYPNKNKEVEMPNDLYQKRHDDIDPDTIHQNRIYAKREEELKKQFLPPGGKE